MGAPRRYSDAQRAAMFALYEQGIQPAEIARRCAAGLTSVAPFQIPRRTAQEIVTGMARSRAERTCRTQLRACSKGTARSSPPGTQAWFSA